MAADTLAPTAGAGVNGAQPPLPSAWQPHLDLEMLAEGIVVPWLEIAGRECTITLEPRPDYCDRGNYLAKIDARGELGRSLDWADGWPRYYFDLERAKLEVEAWLKKRRQWIEPAAETQSAAAPGDDHGT